MKILLLGASSFIGKDLFLRRPHWDWDLFDSTTCDLSDPDAIKSVKGNYDTIINCAGWHGGLPFNQTHAQGILIRNTMILAGVDRLIRQLEPRCAIAIGSGCIYPGSSTDRMNEKLIGSGPYHPSVAFSGMVKLLQLDMMKNLPSHINWHYLILSNVYGPNEHLDYLKGHAVGSLIRKLLTAQGPIEMIGTGSAVRDFFYINDVHEAICRYVECSTETKSPTNISSGQGHDIQTLVDHIANVLQFEHEISWNKNTMQDGVACKVLDNSKMIKEIGEWDFMPIDKGIETTVNYVKNMLTTFGKTL
jgi:GDP-L-fucose synthase